MLTLTALSQALAHLSVTGAVPAQPGARTATTLLLSARAGRPNGAVRGARPAFIPNAGFSAGRLEFFAFNSFLPPKMKSESSVLD